MRGDLLRVFISLSFLAAHHGDVIHESVNRSLTTAKTSSRPGQTNITTGRDNRYVRIGAPDQSGYIGILDIPIHQTSHIRISAQRQTYFPGSIKPRVPTPPPGFISDIDEILGIKRREGFKLQPIKRSIPDVRPIETSKSASTRQGDTGVVGLERSIPVEGLLVVRGPDWRWDDQDGGLGSVGKIIGDIQHGWCTVRWPSGYTNGYRIGASGQYDLRLAKDGSHVMANRNSKSFPSRLDSSFVKKTRETPRSEQSREATIRAEVGPKPDAQVIGMSTQNPVRKGLRVERGPHWQWGDQDGGVGSVGIVVGDIKQGWCTVRWQSGYTNGYRIGHASHYDLRIAKSGPSPSSQERPDRITSSSGYSRQASPGLPITVASGHGRQASPGAVLTLPLVRPGLKVQRGPDWQWRDQDGGIGSVGAVQGGESRGWVRVKWPSGLENGYRVGDGGKFDLVVASNRGPVGKHLQQESRKHAANLPRQQRHAPAQGCGAKARTRCWCIDQYGDVLHLP